MTIYIAFRNTISSSFAKPDCLYFDSGLPLFDQIWNVAKDSTEDCCCGLSMHAGWWLHREAISVKYQGKRKGSRGLYSSIHSFCSFSTDIWIRRNLNTTYTFAWKFERWEQKSFVTFPFLVASIREDIICEHRNCNFSIRYYLLKAFYHCVHLFPSFLLSSYRASCLPHFIKKC